VARGKRGRRRLQHQIKPKRRRRANLAEISWETASRLAAGGLLATLRKWWLSARKGEK
jgi:hypothetical protein